MHRAKAQKIKCPACGWWHYESVYDKPMRFEFASILSAGDRGFLPAEKWTLQDVSRERLERFAQTIYLRCRDIMEAVRAAAAPRGIGLGDDDWPGGDLADGSGGPGGPGRFD